MRDTNSKEEGGKAAGPSLTLLIKLLKMTTSSHDAEALVACRKANAELQKFGGDWDTLLRGKVTVIGDPFANLHKPDVGHTRPHRRAPRRHRHIAMRHLHHARKPQRQLVPSRASRLASSVVPSHSTI